MAVLTAKTSGKASTAATWTPEEAPSATSELVVPTGIEVKVESNLSVVQIKTTGAAKLLLTKALTLTGSGKCLELGSETVVTVTTGKFVLAPAGGVTQEPITNGRDLVVLSFTGAATSKYKLSEALTAGTELNLSKGILSTNGAEVSCGRFLVEGAGVKELVLGASKWKCSTASGTAPAWQTSGASGFTLKAETSTIELTATDATFQLPVGGETYNNLTFSGEVARINGNGTFATVSLNLAGAKREAIFEGGSIQTFTALTKSAGALSLLSASGIENFRLKKVTGTVELEAAKIKASTAEGGATFKDINGEDLGGNTGWTFETVAGSNQNYSMML